VIEWGISAGAHDAALTVVDGKEILFASSAERYSGVKNDKHLNPDLIEAALKTGYEDNWFMNDSSTLCSQAWCSYWEICKGAWCGDREVAFANQSLTD
jgi:hypothetical protein